MEYNYEPGEHLAGVDFDKELRGELRLKHSVSLPNHTLFDDEVEVEGDDEGEELRAEELREVWEEVRIGDWLGGSHLQIGGYASDTEGWGDPVARCAWEARKRDSGAAPVEEAVLEDWVLLAEWHLALTGFEMATMYWAIRRQDIAARRFDRAAVTMYANPRPPSSARQARPLQEEEQPTGAVGSATGWPAREPPTSRSRQR